MRCSGAQGETGGSSGIEEAGDRRVPISESLCALSPSLYSNGSA